MDSNTDVNVTAPNGERVTLGKLYQALYDLDQGISERFTELIVGQNQLRRDFERHREDGHPIVSQAEQVKLDTKKAAIAAGLLALLTAIATVAGKFVDIIFF